VEVEFEDSGEQALKNIAAPVRVYTISPLAIGMAEAAAPMAAPAPRQEMPAPKPEAAPVAADPAAPVAMAGSNERPTIAILPFANLGGDPEQSYFSDGFSEDLITELSRWRTLQVRSRSASFRFRGVGLDMREVAQELDVRYLLEGSVRRMGERLRITAQLIDTETGNHLWAERFDRTAQEIFAVQDEVVRTLVGTLVGRVHAASLERARRKPTTNLAAYECVLRGNALHWSTAEGAAEATALFERAIALDPGYGHAHALLGEARRQAWLLEPPGDDRLIDEALVLARKAVALDDAESNTHALLAYVQLSRGAFDEALRSMQRAVEINPGNPWNQADMGQLLLHLGRNEEALAWLQRARAIDPFFNPAWYWRSCGHALFNLGREREALAMIERAQPASWRGAALAAACHAHLGEAEAAAARVRDCLQRHPRFSVSAYMAKLPFLVPAEAARLREAMLMAGLPP
jgi:TolB-like protein